MSPIDNLLTICRQCGAVLTSHTRKKHKAWHKANRAQQGPPGPQGPMGPQGNPGSPPMPPNPYVTWNQS